MIRSAEVRTESEARQWEARLNRDWPQRAQVAAWIVAQISAKSANPLRVVELACGAGFLGEVLLRQLPTARYCGFDLSPHLLENARRRLSDCATPSGMPCDVELRCVDLVRANWEDELTAIGWSGRVDGFVSLQALHDLGGFAQQQEVLARARNLLRPGGLLVYADLLLEPENPHSSRFTAAQHAEMLRAAGFNPDGAPQPDGSAANACFGEFGCFRWRK